jgi:hypothetical protein
VTRKLNDMGMHRVPRLIVELLSYMMQRLLGIHRPESMHKM